MTLGTSRPRNWGREAQQLALDLVLRRRSVAYEVRPVRAASRETRFTLWITPSRDGITLPFIQSAADLVLVRRGRWEAQHPFDGRVLATGISKRDVVRATIEQVCQ